MQKAYYPTFIFVSKLQDANVGTIQYVRVCVYVSLLSWICLDVVPVRLGIEKIFLYGYGRVQ